MTTDVIAFRDGRRLCWHELGDPEGSPVIYTAGTPVSGLGGPIPFTVMRWSLARSARRERSLRREMAVTPEAKHAGLRIEFEAVADALRPGTRGAVQERALIRPPWPFPLGEVETPVHLWHGARDTNAPIAIAHRVARELPDATLYVSDTSGHDVGLDRSGEIMSVIARYVR